MFRPELGKQLVDAAWVWDIESPDPIVFRGVVGSPIWPVSNCCHEVLVLRLNWDVLVSALKVSFTISAL